MGPDTRQPVEFAANEAPEAVFVSDASAEADRIAHALRARGYGVVDVPLSLLAARVAVQRPALVLIDADAPGALETAQRVREAPGGHDVRLVMLAERDRPAQPELEATLADAQWFRRPADEAGVVASIERLVPRPARASVAPGRRIATPTPPSVQPGPWRPSSAPPPSDEDPAGPLRLAPTSLSPEIRTLLRQAEDRFASETPYPSAPPPPPDQELDAVLPPDVLAALDAPLDLGDDELASDVAREATPWRNATPSPDPPPARAAQREVTAVASARSGPPSRAPDGRRVTSLSRAPAAPSRAPDATPGPPRAEIATVPPRAPSSPPDPRVHVASPERADAHTMQTPRPPRHASAPPFAAPLSPRILATEPPASVPGSMAPATQAFVRHVIASPPRSVPPPSGSPLDGLPRELGEGDALRVLAACVAARASGSVCLEASGGIRRVVLREGDAITAASGLDEESLLAFLVGRGDLAREQASRLRGKLPPFGRHAGAALVAHGLLGQDQLWPVLRSHAEWVVGRAIDEPRGTWSLESDPPGRLKGEPSVFGGSTGAEVLLEVARRVVSVEVALARLGGARARVAEGPRPDLLAECGLSEDEATVLARAHGGTLADALEQGAPAELAITLHVLALLGIVEMLAPDRPASDRPAAAADALDDQALRERVRARLALVQEADYFALLGVPRTATAYDVKRAYLELRRAFEPARALRPSTADLADDLCVIVEVLDEAWEVLRDGARRDRYRRAIEGAPPG